ncbi:MauE/DoxX family redox-associated membrane protein [Micromonospora sp. NPDC048930]|uniref:MauE/DoxX family redox-associated membrane protein n=1 Tax=Micromonospora sp. NPDC048930 TaxID=3364261 RepID=UPI00371997D9
MEPAPAPGRLTTVSTPRDRAIRWPLLRPWLATAARLGLAAVWLTAGGSKVGDLGNSGRAVNAYQVMPYDVAAVIGAALPFVELALGVLLLIGLATRLAAGISTALLVVFITGIASAWARGLAIDCGCFGGGGELAAGQAPSYLPEILRDLGFLALAGFLLIWPRTPFSVDGWLAGEPPVEGEDE